MSNNNVLIEKKKALLTYKEKIQEEIKYYERTIEDFRENRKNNSHFEDVDSSDSEDDFPPVIDTGPTVPQLKVQQDMLKTCLQATKELTSLTVLQSEVNVLVEDPKLDGEMPVVEAGCWTEVTAECRIDLVSFSISFFMHKPDRKFAPPSYRGLRVLPVKYAHEIELAKSVLHTLKLPSDAIQVLKSYAAGYRSRRTTLARLANKYANALFMELHPEGGFVLKCADLLEVSWRLENKWSPVAPFHHRMKFDLEYMDESFIKIITQAHKQLLDPAIQTDERTLLLAKIISTCLEARGPIDPDSDLESKTTERDNETEKRDSETEKRDSEVMAPPKSLPKKPKQKNKDSLPNIAQKRSMDDENGEAKRMKNKEMPSDELKKSNADVGINPRKSKMSDVVNVGGKKSKPNDDSHKNKDKVASNLNKNSANIENRNTNTKANNKIVKETGNQKNDKVSYTKPKNKNVKESGNVDDKGSNTKSKSKTIKESGTIINKDSNIKPKNQNVEEIGDGVNTNTKTKNKVVNAKLKTKIVKDTEQDKGNPKSKNVKEPSNIEPGKDNNTKPKNITAKEAGNSEDNNKDNNTKPKSIEKKKAKNLATTITSENKNNVANIITKTKGAEHQNNKPTEKRGSVANPKNAENNLNKANTKPKTTKTAKSKENNVANKKNDDQTVKKVDKDIKDKDHKDNNNKPEVTNKGSKIAIVKLAALNSKSDNTVKKVTEKNANNKKNTDKISTITNIVSDMNVKEKGTTNIIKETVPEKVLSGNVVTNKESKDIINNKKVTAPTKTMKTMPHRLSSHRTALKTTNSQKTLKPGNTKILKSGNTKILNSGNTEKENSGTKISKIPQKKLSPISESSLKKNPLRISPRKLPSKFKSSSQNAFKQKMIKTTNIPRLLKISAPKTTIK